MPLMTGDFYALAPIWGTFEADVDDEAQFEFEALNYVKDTHEGATQIDIRNVKTVEA